MDAKSLTVLDDIIAGSCRAVFEAAGAPLEEAAGVEGTADDIGASIGFTGSTLRGALVLISSRRLIRDVLPAEVGGADRDDRIADWMGELSNQMLGRIKNKLLAYGITLEMSTPTVLFGLSLSRQDARSGVRRTFLFRHGADSLAVSFDAVMAPDFQLSVPQAEQGPGIAEGEIALF